MKNKQIFESRKCENSTFFLMFLPVSLMSGLIEDVAFSCLLLNSICCDITSFSLWKIQLYIHERVRIKKANNVLSLLPFAKIHLDLTEPLEA